MPKLDDSLSLFLKRVKAKLENKQPLSNLEVTLIMAVAERAVADLEVDKLGDEPMEVEIALYND